MKKFTLKVDEKTQKTATILYGDKQLGGIFVNQHPLIRCINWLHNLNLIDNKEYQEMLGQVHSTKMETQVLVGQAKAQFGLAGFSLSIQTECPAQSENGYQFLTDLSLEVSKEISQKVISFLMDPLGNTQAA
jgi:hypothetical protein